MLFREIEINDFSITLFQMLNSLSQSIEISNDSISTFEKYFEDFLYYLSKNKHHKVFIYFDEKENKIVGIGTLLIERKIIHNFGKVGHIEDIVIAKEYQKKGYGKELIKQIIEIGKKEGCYKVILNCKDEFEDFYKKCGFVKKSSQMALYF